MARLIDADAFIEVLKNPTLFEEKLEITMDDIAFLVDEQPTTTEAEIRAKAIDEFAEKAMRKLTELELKNTCYTVTDCKIILRDVAEQLKEE